MADVIVFMTNGTEEVEALTVVDMLIRAGISTHSASIDETNEITGSHGITIKVDTTFDDICWDSVKMIVLPGGMPGTNRLMDCEKLCNKLKEFNEDGKMLAAVCAAPSILGVNGILQGKKATCYPGYEEKLLGAEYKKMAVVRDANVITSRGLGTTIEFAAEIINCLEGEEKAKALLKKIIYKD